MALVSDYGRSPMEDLIELQWILNRIPMRERIRLAVLRVLERNVARGGWGATGGNDGGRCW